MREKDLLRIRKELIVDLSDYNLSPAVIMKRCGSTLYNKDIAAAIYIEKEHYDFYKNIYVVKANRTFISSSGFRF